MSLGFKTYIWNTGLPCRPRPPSTSRFPLRSCYCLTSRRKSQQACGDHIPDVPFLRGQQLCVRF